MKIISKQKVLLVNDREGKLEEFLQIDIRIKDKDDVAKIYTLETVDSVVYSKGEVNESTSIYNNRIGNPQIKLYCKTYEEYDAQREILEQYFPTELTGSEKDDFLLQMGLLQNLINDPIYGVEFEAR